MWDQNNWKGFLDSLCRNRNGPTPPENSGAAPEASLSASSSTTTIYNSELQKQLETENTAASANIRVGSNSDAPRKKLSFGSAGPGFTIASTSFRPPLMGADCPDEDEDHDTHVARLNAKLSGGGGVPIAGSGSQQNSPSLATGRLGGPSDRVQGISPPRLVQNPTLGDANRVEGNNKSTEIPTGENNPKKDSEKDGAPPGEDNMEEVEGDTPSRSSSAANSSSSQSDSSSSSLIASILHSLTGEDVELLEEELGDTEGGNTNPGENESGGNTGDLQQPQTDHGGGKASPGVVPPSSAGIIISPSEEATLNAIEAMAQEEKEEKEEDEIQILSENPREMPPPSPWLPGAGPNAALRPENSGSGGSIRGPNPDLNPEAFGRELLQRTAPSPWLPGASPLELATAAALRLNSQKTSTTAIPPSSFTEFPHQNSSNVNSVEGEGPAYPVRQLPPFPSPLPSSPMPRVHWTPPPLGSFEAPASYDFNTLSSNLTEEIYDGGDHSVEFGLWGDPSTGPLPPKPYLASNFLLGTFCERMLGGGSVVGVRDARHVNFRSERLAERAVARLHGSTLDGRRIMVRRWVNERGDPNRFIRKGWPPSRGRTPSPSFSPTAPEPCDMVIVGEGTEKNRRRVEENETTDRGNSNALRGWHESRPIEELSPQTQQSGQDATSLGRFVLIPIIPLEEEQEKNRSKKDNNSAFSGQNRSGGRDPRLSKNDEERGKKQSSIYNNQTTTSSSPSSYLRVPHFDYTDTEATNQQDTTTSSSIDSSETAPEQQQQTMYGAGGDGFNQGPGGRQSNFQQHWSPPTDPRSLSRLNQQLAQHQQQPHQPFGIHAAAAGNPLQPWAHGNIHPHPLNHPQMPPFPPRFPQHPNLLNVPPHQMPPPHFFPPRPPHVAQQQFPGPEGRSPPLAAAFSHHPQPPPRPPPPPPQEHQSKQQQNHEFRQQQQQISPSAARNNNNKDSPSNGNNKNNGRRQSRSRSRSPTGGGGGRRDGRERSRSREPGRYVPPSARDQPEKGTGGGKRRRTLEQLDQEQREREREKRREREKGESSNDSPRRRRRTPSPSARHRDDDEFSSRWRYTDPTPGETYNDWLSFFKAAGIPTQYCEKYAKSFVNEWIKPESLKEMDEDQLLKLGISSRNDRKATLNYIKKCSGSPPQFSTTQKQQPSSTAPSTSSSSSDGHPAPQKQQQPHGFSSSSSSGTGGDKNKPPLGGNKSAAPSADPNAKKGGKTDEPSAAKTKPQPPPPIPTGPIPRPPVPPVISSASAAPKAAPKSTQSGKQIPANNVQQQSASSAGGSGFGTFESRGGGASVGTESAQSAAAPASIDTVNPQILMEKDAQIAELRAELEREKRDHEAMMSLKQTEIDESQAEKLKLRFEQSQHDDKIRDQKAKTEIERAEKEEEKRAHQKTREELERVKAEAAQLTPEALEKLRAELDSERKLRLEAESESQLSKSIQAKIQGELGEAEKRVETLKREKEQLAVKLAKVRDENRNAVENSETLQKALADSKKETKRAMETADNLQKQFQRRIQDLEAENERAVEAAVKAKEEEMLKKFTERQRLERQQSVQSTSSTVQSLESGTSTGKAGGTAAEDGTAKRKKCPNEKCKEQRKKLRTFEAKQKECEEKEKEFRERIAQVNQDALAIRADRDRALRNVLEELSAKNSENAQLKRENRSLKNKEASYLDQIERLTAIKVDADNEQQHEIERGGGPTEGGQFPQSQHLRLSLQDQARDLHDVRPGDSGGGGDGEDEFVGDGDDFRDSAVPIHRNRRGREGTAETQISAASTNISSPMEITGGAGFGPHNLRRRTSDEFAAGDAPPSGEEQSNSQPGVNQPAPPVVNLAEEDDEEQMDENIVEGGGQDATILHSPSFAEQQQQQRIVDSRADSRCSLVDRINADLEAENQRQIAEQQRCYEENRRNLIGSVGQLNPLLLGNCSTTGGGLQGGGGQQLQLQLYSGSGEYSAAAGATSSSSNSLPPIAANPLPPPPYQPQQQQQPAPPAHPTSTRQHPHQQGHQGMIVTQQQFSGTINNGGSAGQTPPAMHPPPPNVLLHQNPPPLNHNQSMMMRPTASSSSSSYPQQQHQEQQNCDCDDCVIQYAQQALQQQQQQFLLQHHQGQGRGGGGTGGGGMGFVPPGGAVVNQQHQIVQQQQQPIAQLQQQFGGGTPVQPRTNFGISGGGGGIVGGGGVSGGLPPHQHQYPLQLQQQQAFGVAEVQPLQPPPKRRRRSTGGGSTTPTAASSTGTVPQQKQQPRRKRTPTAAAASQQQPLTATATASSSYPQQQQFQPQPNVAGGTNVLLPSVLHSQGQTTQAHQFLSDMNFPPHLAHLVEQAIDQLLRHPPEVLLGHLQQLQQQQQQRPGIPAQPVQGQIQCQSGQQPVGNMNTGIINQQQQRQFTTAQMPRVFHGRPVQPHQRQHPPPPVYDQQSNQRQRQIQAPPIQGQGVGQGTRGSAQPPQHLQIPHQISRHQRQQMPNDKRRNGAASGIGVAQQQPSNNPQQPQQLQRQQGVTGNGGSGTGFTQVFQQMGQSQLAINQYLQQQQQPGSSSAAVAGQLRQPVMMTPESTVRQRQQPQQIHQQQRVQAPSGGAVPPQIHQPEHQQQLNQTPPPFQQAFSEAAITSKSDVAANSQISKQQQQQRSSSVGSGCSTGSSAPPPGAAGKGKRAPVPEGGGTPLSSRPQQQRQKSVEPPSYPILEAHLADIINRSGHQQGTSSEHQPQSAPPPPPVVETTTPTSTSTRVVLNQVVLVGSGGSGASSVVNRQTPPVEKTRPSVGGETTTPQSATTSEQRPGGTGIQTTTPNDGASESVPVPIGRLVGCPRRAEMAAAAEVMRTPSPAPAPPELSPAEEMAEETVEEEDEEEGAEAIDASPILEAEVQTIEDDDDGDVDAEVDPPVVAFVGGSRRGGQGNLREEVGGTSGSGLGDGGGQYSHGIPPPLFERFRNHNPGVEVRGEAMGELSDRLERGCQEMLREERRNHRRLWAINPEQQGNRELVPWEVEVLGPEIQIDDSD